MRFEFLKRHTLALASTAALVPLLILLTFQFVWLGHLKKASAAANHAALSNFLESVGKEVQYFYETNAERALNVPASLFHQDRLDEVAYQWKKKPVAGARRLFLVDFTTGPYGRYLFYDPETHTLRSPPASDESMAVIVATTSWNMVRSRTHESANPSFVVDERNPDYRIIFNPILDEESDLVGLGGMILDEWYFQHELLPTVINRSLPRYFPGSAATDLVVTVRDRGGRVQFATGAVVGKREAEKRAFNWVFSDYRLALHGARNMPERWANASFLFNLSLSALLALALIGGLAFALRAAGRAMALSEMKSDFVSNVSHELRTPLASIRVFAELLRLGRVTSPEKVREYGGTIEAEIRRLTALINNILDFARIESGRKTYQFASADLGCLVEGVLHGFEMRLSSIGFRVRYTPPDSPLPPVEMDADAITQALLNLLDNAVKYSGDSKEIAVRLAREEDQAVISVTDRGIGIAREEQPRVFERFHRVSTGLIHDVKGSGLGLSIVRHIMQAHHGQVTVESEPGRGSTFALRMPFVRRGGSLVGASEAGLPRPGAGAAVTGDPA